MLTDSLSQHLTKTQNSQTNHDLDKDTNPGRFFLIDAQWADRGVYSDTEVERAALKEILAASN